MTDSALSPGRRLGKYEIREKFATGGMADLYLATASGAAGFAKTLLLKVLRPELADQRRFVEMLADEARISARLDHECIVRVHDFEEAQGLRFLVLEYVPGIDLARVLDRMDAAGALVPERFAVGIAARVARGLAYAHAARDETGPLGVVHRDVNPSNILVSREGEVKILDFGIAKAISRVSRTEFGELKGKVLYMAPEQARGNDVDARTDIYALGMVLYEMVTGVPLLAGDSDLEVLRRAREAEFPSPREFRPDLNPDLEAIVLRCLTKDPAARYATAGDLEDALDAYLIAAHGPVRAKDLAAWVAPMLDEPPADRAAHRTDVLPRTRAPRTPIALASPTHRRPIFVAVAVAVAVAVFWWTRTTPSPPLAPDSGPPPPVVGVATVETNVPGALLLVDGRLVGRLPATVATGDKTVGATATLPGHLPWTGRFKASPTKARKIAATLYPAYATLRVPDSATITIDGIAAAGEDGEVAVRAGLRRVAIDGRERLVRFAPGETRDAEGKAVAPPPVAQTGDDPPALRDGDPRP
jgi:serine/threonine-protein kinase